MKKERMLCGLSLMMILNWMMHHEAGAVIYFSAVMTSLLIYYRSVQLELVFESALIRFVMILSVCLYFSKELNFLDAAAWMMICTASSAFAQRVQKSEEAFLYHLSMLNMACMPVLLIVVLFCMNGSEFCLNVLMITLALFQPSGLALANPLDSLDNRKSPAAK